MNDTPESLPDVLAGGDSPFLAGEHQGTARALRDRLRAQEHELRRWERGLDAVRAVMGALRDADDEGQLLGRIPHEVCRACDFDRVVLFRIQGSELVLTSLYFSGDRDGALGALDVATRHPPKLTPLLRETDMMLRRTPGLVLRPREDPRAHQPLAHTLRSDAYVATPILSADRRPIAFLHADRFPGNDPVGPVDRDILWALAEGVGSLIERAALVSQVQRGRERIRRLSAELAATLQDDDDATIDLRVPPLLPGPRTRQARRIRLPDDAVSSSASLLTRRELEVLSLMARGETNAEIAADLAVSENTVKSHVKQILRKLQAANRAQAVSRYHGLLEDGPPV